MAGIIKLRENLQPKFRNNSPILKRYLVERTSILAIHRDTSY